MERQTFAYLMLFLLFALGAAAIAYRIRHNQARTSQRHERRQRRRYREGEALRVARLDRAMEDEPLPIVDQRPLAP